MTTAKKIKKPRVVGGCVFELSDLREIEIVLQSDGSGRCRHGQKGPWKTLNREETQAVLFALQCDLENWENLPGDIRKPALAICGPPTTA